MQKLMRELEDWYDSMPQTGRTKEAAMLNPIQINNVAAAAQATRDNAIKNFQNINIPELKMKLRNDARNVLRASLGFRPLNNTNTNISWGYMTPDNDAVVQEEANLFQHQLDQWHSAQQYIADGMELTPAGRAQLAILLDKGVDPKTAANTVVNNLTNIAQKIYRPGAYDDGTVEKAVADARSVKPLVLPENTASQPLPEVPNVPTASQPLPKVPNVPIAKSQTPFYKNPNVLWGAGLGGLLGGGLGYAFGNKNKKLLSSLLGAGGGALLGGLGGSYFGNKQS